MNSASRARVLPSELMHTIFSEATHFNPAQLMSLALVCREWYDLVVSEPSLWCHLDASYSITAPQWHLQLSRSAKAALHVRIDPPDVGSIDPYQPELFAGIIVQNIYIPRIQSLSVHRSSTRPESNIDLSHWEALADGREWSALRTLSVTDYTRDTRLFQLNIHAPLLEKITISFTSVRDWKSLGLGPSTQYINWYLDRPPATEVADFYEVLSRLVNLTVLDVVSDLGLFTLHALTRATLALDKLTDLYLGFIDATIEEIEAVIRSNPRLVQFNLWVRKEITGSLAPSHFPDQRGASRNRLKIFGIRPRSTSNELQLSSMRDTLCQLVENYLDLSGLRDLHLAQSMIPRGSSWLPRCTELANLSLTAVVLCPAFIADLQQCQNLETLFIHAVWDEMLPDDAWPTLDNLTPLPRLYSAFLLSYDVENNLSTSPAAVYGTAAFIRLAGATCQDVLSQACILDSAADIRILLPQTPPDSVRLSLIAKNDVVDQLLVDVCLEWSSINLSNNDIPMSRKLFISQHWLPALFDAMRLWLGSASELKSVSLHDGLADRATEAVQVAMELFTDSEFTSCPSSSACLHTCRTGDPLPKFGKL